MIQMAWAVSAFPQLFAERTVDLALRAVAFMFAALVKSYFQILSFLSCSRRDLTIMSYFITNLYF